MASELKFGVNPFDQHPEIQARYHVVDTNGYIRWKSVLGVIAYDHAGNLSDREAGIFKVIDTRDGSEYGSWCGGQSVS